MKKEISAKAGIVLSLVGAVLMFFGYYRGEASTVLIKAIKICLECIGIG